MSNPPLRATIVPVTPLQQNCSIIWCTATNRAAVIDPGGDIDRIKQAVQTQDVTVEKIVLTHGHIDHAGGARQLAEDLGVPIEGPHEADRFWIARLEEDGRSYGITARSFEPDRWLVEGDTVTIGQLTLDVYLTPGHTPGHVVFHHPASKLAITGDVLFKGSIGRTDFPLGDHEALLESVRTKLWLMGDDTAFLPGHGPMSNFAQERRTNPFVADQILAKV